MLVREGHVDPAMMASSTAVDIHGQAHDNPTVWLGFDLVIALGNPIQTSRWTSRWILAVERILLKVDIARVNDLVVALGWIVPRHPAIHRDIKHDVGHA